jgi:hypothetical protein
MDMAAVEKELGVMAGDGEDSRIRLVQVGEPGEVPTLEVRLQRHCNDLGWVTHRRIRMAPGQIGDLQDAINLMDPDARQADIDHDRERRKAGLSIVEDSEQTKSSG